VPEADRLKRRIIKKGIKVAKTFTGCPKIGIGLEKSAAITWKKRRLIERTNKNHNGERNYRIIINKIM
jgi:hypothetical protein